MQGQTEGCPVVNPTIKGALEYRYLDNVLLSLRHPVGEDIIQGEESLLLASHGGSGSLVPSFCDEYIKLSQKQVLAIHVARGATRVDEWLPGTERYEAMLRKVRDGIKKISDSYPIERICFIWLQGESDAVAETPTKVYKQRFLTLKTALKQAVGVQTFGIIKVGYFASQVSWMKRGTPDERLGFDKAIMQAQEELVQEEDDCVMLTRICESYSLCTEKLNPSEAGHYNNAAMEDIGRAAARGLF